MSEEINFDFAWKMLHIYLQRGLTEAKVSELPTSLRKLAKSIGYEDDDIVSLLTLKEYLDKTGGILNANLDANASVHQCIDVHQGAECTLEQSASMHQVASTNDNDVDAKRFTLTLRQQKTTSSLLFFNFFDTNNLEPNKVPIRNPKVLPDLLRDVNPALITDPDNELHRLLKNDLLRHLPTSAIITDIGHKKVSLPNLLKGVSYCTPSYPQDFYGMGNLGYNRECGVVIPSTTQGVALYG